MITDRKLITIFVSILIACMLFMLGGCGSGGGSGSGSDVHNPPADTPSKVNVTGTVFDKFNNHVEGAQVTISSDPVTVTTDANGNFSVEVEAGDHEIEIVKNDEVIYSDSFACGAEDTYSLGNIATSYESDSTFSETGKLIAPNAEAWEQLGNSVSISGDYAVIGLSLDREEGVIAKGAAYVYQKTALNSWDSGTKIVSPEPASGEFFGTAVAISGDYIIVGAPKHNVYSSELGAAYIYRRTGQNTWDSGTKILAPDGVIFDNFGMSVAIDGDYAIVGATDKDDGADRTGAVYIFRRIGLNTWDSGTKITVPNAIENAFFGNSVALSGNYVIIGANIGTYVFQRTGLNTWDTGTKLSGSSSSVAISGDYAIVGYSSSYVRIYRRIDANTWDSVAAELYAPDGESYDRYGRSVAIRGDYAIVGAIGKDVHWDEDGAVFIYKRTGLNTWDSGTKLMETASGTDDGIGSAIAFSGDKVIITAPGDDEGAKNAGAAYIFTKSP